MNWVYFHHFARGMPNSTRRSSGKLVFDGYFFLLGGCYFYFFIIRVESNQSILLNYLNYLTYDSNSGTEKAGSFCFAVERSQPFEVASRSNKCATQESRRLPAHPWWWHSLTHWALLSAADRCYAISGLSSPSHLHPRCGVRVRACAFFFCQCQKYNETWASVFPCWCACVYTRRLSHNCV